MDKDKVISKKAVAELEQMFADKGYLSFSLYDESRQQTIEGRLSEVLAEYIVFSPSNNFLPELESVSGSNASNNEFTDINFIVDISNDTGPDVREVGIRKHGQHISAGKSFTIKSPDEIPSKDRAVREANALFKYVQGQKRKIKM